MIPKFRAFIKANTKTMYGGLDYSDDCVLPVGLIDFTDGEVTVWGCGREDCGLCGDDFWLDDIVLMQSTGLKDKNGVDIYEGDYLSLIVFEANSEYKGEVVFSRGSFCVAIQVEGRDYKVALHETSEADTLMEVLGNIYENTELLEDTE